MVIDLSTLAKFHDNLLPGERATVHIAGKAYMWNRHLIDGPLSLYPGYVPNDPAGCPMTEPVGVFQTSWPRVCVLHRRHAGQHAHKPTLDTPVERWGPDRTPRPTLLGT